MRIKKSLAAAQALFVAGVWAQILVDDGDAQIVYTPAESWTRNPVADPMDDGGFHMLTNDPGATASFSFIGTGIEYSAPLWSDDIHTAVSLDGAGPVFISLADPDVAQIEGGAATQPSDVRWSAMDLENTQHTLVVSVPVGMTFAVLDSLTYYTSDEDPTTSTPTTTSTPPNTNTRTTTSDTSTPTSNTNTTSSSSSGTQTGLTIALSVVCSVAGVLLLIGLFFFMRRKRSKDAERRAWLKAQQDPSPLMDEIDDGVRAGGARFKSIPSRKNLVDGNGSGSDLGSPGYGGGGMGEAAVAAYRQGQSKLRNVVTSQYGESNRQSQVGQVRPSAEWVRQQQQYASGAPPVPAKGPGHSRTGSHVRSGSSVSGQGTGSPPRPRFTMGPECGSGSAGSSFRGGEP